MSTRTDQQHTPKERVDTQDGITAGDLIPTEGRLGTKRMNCPHPKCTWWVPEGREHIADAHVCPGPEYEKVDYSQLEDTDDVDRPIDYVGKFVNKRTGKPNLKDLYEDADPRPRSERLELIFGFEAFGYQKAMLDDPNPDKSINTGRQIGKTETAGAIGADAILFECIPSGDDLAFFGDVDDTAQEMFRRCKKHLENCPLSMDRLGVERDNETFWEFEGGERIITGTLNNGGDNERGKLPKVVVSDEAALSQRSAFKNVIDPMFMTHGDDHEFYALSTPRGQNGYHYDAHVPGRKPDYFSPHNVPAWANPLVSESWLRKKRDNIDSNTWEQEYLGIFVEEGNAYIPMSTYRPNVANLPIAQTPPQITRVSGHPKDGVQYFGGTDIAGQGNDRTVYTIMAEDGTAVHIEYEEKSRTPGVVGRIGELYNEYGFSTMLVDQNALGQGVADYSAADFQLRQSVIGMPFSTPKKSAMYKAFKNALEGEALQLPKHGMLERETTKLEFSYTQNRHVKVSHPENGHDDFPDSAALANFARVGGHNGQSAGASDAYSTYSY